MRLIGMMDSPYVRRVAVSLKFLQIPFAHEPVSVFRQFAEFSALNPVVKAPTLITDDDIVLMDSTLIVDFAEQLATPERGLMPADLQQYARGQRLIGLALAACDKTVQLVYEFDRPADKQHQPWIERVRRQMREAYRLLEAELNCEGGWLLGDSITQADISAAITWRFNQFVLHEELAVESHPKLAEFSRRAEALPEFASTPLE